MIGDLWKAFPRLLEQNINGLLEAAPPNPGKAFMLYKSCKNEGLWRDGFENFSLRLEEFFSRPRAHRRKSHFDVFLDRPMDHTVYEGFHLNFRTAAVSETAVNNLASWAHNLIRVSKKTTSAAISLDVMEQTLYSIVNPRPEEKAENIEFEDFCAAWKKTVARFFGEKHDGEFKAILAELHWINHELKVQEAEARERSLPPDTYLTWSETEWTIAVRKAAFENAEIPKFPLEEGPSKQRLRELDRVIQLYRALRTTRLPELMKHRANTRATLLDRCDQLLEEKKAA